MKFSFIVPVYKVENYIKRCIDSIICQTYADIEIILVDDGSPDECPKICDEYARKDHRIQVIHQKNGGLSDARNSGLKIAKGEYIIFVDSDDYVEKKACELFLALTDRKYDILVGDAYVEGGVSHVDHIKSNIVMTGEQYLEEAFLHSSAPRAVWLNIYRREFLNENDLFFKYGILHEDEEFTPRCFLKAKTVFCTGIYFYHYVIRQGSIMRQLDKRKNAVDIYNTCLELEDIYEKLDNFQLKSLLLDSLVVLYLKIYYEGHLCRYGNEYIHKEFCKRNAYTKRSKIKSLIFCISPRMYCMINKFTKELK